MKIGQIGSTNSSKSIPRRNKTKKKGDNNVKNNDAKGITSNNDDKEREKRLSLPPEQVRKIMMETLQKSNRKPEPGEIGAAAKGPKSMKIDRKIRMKLYYLSHART